MVYSTQTTLPVPAAPMAAHDKRREGPAIATWPCLRVNIQHVCHLIKIIKTITVEQISRDFFY